MEICFDGIINWTITKRSIKVSIADIVVHIAALAAFIILFITAIKVANNNSEGNKKENQKTKGFGDKD